MADIAIQLEEASSAPAPSPRSGGRVLWRPWMGFAALAAVVAVGGAFAWRTWRGPEMTEPLRAVPLTSLPGVVRAPSLSPDGNHVAFSWTGVKQDNPDIYVQQIGAGNPLQLTTNPANDYGPSWSPDGRTIAFLRRVPAGDRIEVRLIAPLGGPERKLADIQPRMALFRPNSVGWCPDSTCVVVTDAQADGKPDAVFVIALDTGERRQLTYPEGQVADADPLISPDGRALIFRRDPTPFSGAFHRLALKDHVVPEGHPVQLTSTLAAGRPAWLPGGREILFAGRGGLWRLDALKGGTPTRVSSVGQDGQTPTVSSVADGSRLVYVHSFSDTNVWRVDTPDAGAPATPPTAAIVSTRADGIASLSQNGTQATFMSGRSGEWEVWSAALDGSNAIQVTSLAVNPGYPRWSPDGTLITFHGDPNSRADVLLVPASGGKVKILTAGTAGGAFPNFSRDGHWIYFSSVQSGREGGIWKLPVSGGPAVQITNDRGAIAIESYDGRDLYYLEATDRPSPVWRVSLPNGSPVKVLDGVVLGAYDVAERGIYYIERVTGEAGAFFTDRAGGEARLQFFDFATHRSTTVAQNLGTVWTGLSASRDGRTILYSRVDSAVDELMLVDKFR